MIQSKLIFRTISIKIYQSVLQVAADTKEYTANQWEGYLDPKMELTNHSMTKLTRWLPGYKSKNAWWNGLKHSYTTESSRWGQLPISFTS